ncbi:P-selectin-like isoform X3 [Rhea pennata]|uniref:P-selectin-like isoform X3 n=1 Tax=Rhea pennata TaxID=8795 RepID=UPI002E273241
MGLRSAGRTWRPASRGICYLGIAAATWGLVVKLEVGAWTYHYNDQKDYTWEQSRNYCQTYFTDLVAIQNKKEVEYLNKWLPFHQPYYWIGIRKLNGIWTWVGTGKALTKEAENWAEKEPNNKRSNQDCVEIYIKRQRESGKWNDEPCNKRKRALCYQASCQPFPCSQRGECVETIGNYSCECWPGFHGRDCENVVTCPVLSAPDWGELSCSHLHGNFSFGSTCTYSCQTGFVLMGPQSRECTATGDWTGQPPQCEAIKCPALAVPAIGHATCSHLHGNFSFGSTCTFSCQTGFVLTGPQSRECTATGDWTGQLTQCKVVTCPVLSAPDQGELSCSHLHGNFSFGSTCTFSCQTGFTLMGSQSRECTTTGDWTGQPPQCEAIKCPALAIPAMGHATCSHLHGNFSFGSTCTFSCQTGFVLMGPQSRECTATGDWTGQPPQCEAIKCPALAVPTMGHIACSHLHGNFSFGSTCTYSCQTGFVLMGQQSRECTATGDWTGQPPQCEAIKCPALAVPTMGHAACSHLHGNFSFGSTCTYSCQTGFVLMGQQSRECTATGDWTGQPPQCEAIKCPALAVPTMGHAACSHLHGNFSFGSTCTFSCQTGFVLMGPQSRECTATGDWTGQPPQCEAIKCPTLAVPTMGHIACSHLHGNFSFGSTCTFSCQTGFTLMGPQSRECTATGDWTGQPPQCEAIKCPALAVPTMGHAACSHLHGNFSFGSTCTFSCQTGFVLMGPQSRECTATGDWTGQPPQCEAIKCPTLAVPTMGHAACSHLHGNFSFGSTCTFSCQTGFVLMGPQSRECTATGDWTGQPPQCEEDAASFLKQVLVYSGSTALVAASVVLSGTLIALLVKRLSDREEKKKLLNPTSDLGSPGIFTNAAYDPNL